MSNQTLTTTTIAVDPGTIDWQTIRSRGHFVKYTIPFTEKMKWDYLHNWYLTTSQYPYFLNTGARALYVKYPSEAAVVDLDYDGQRWHPSIMDIEDPKLFHALVKLLMSDFFQQREVFVSNGDFYLLVYKTEGRDNAKVLEIKLVQQWREGQMYTFALEDSATTLVKIDSLRDPSMHRSYYGIDYQRGLPILRRISPKKITKQHIELGVFGHLKKKRYKTSIRYVDIGSTAVLKKSRLYSISKFMSDLITYFNQIGLPFSPQQLNYQRVNRMSPEQFRKPQIDLRTKTVYVVDDRIRPAICPNLEPPGFADDLANRVTSMLDQSWTPQLVRRDKSALHAGDLVLRLQDNTANDFVVEQEIDSTGTAIELNAAVLRSYDDPYHTYRAAHSDTITQSLNINMLTDSEDDAFDDADDEDVDGAILPTEQEEARRQQQAAPYALDEYMSYRLPSRSAAFQASLLNCFYQLHLKHLVRNPQNAVAELDALALMGDNIFLYADSLVYLNQGSLTFLPTSNNEAAVDIIRRLTGWDLLEDIILPAIERKAYQPSDTLKPEDIELILRSGRFIINRDYVWQIEDSQTRVMYPIPEIHRRLLALEAEHPTDVFRPSYSDAELEIFTREQLEAFDDYLNRHLGDYVSFKTLISHEHGSAGFYPLLGIKNSTKFKTYLRTKGLVFESPKGSDAIVAYTGISYMPETQQYYVGDKYAIDERYRQDKGFVLRKIVVHRTRSNSQSLFEQLSTNLFPLLEVNFVRYNQYTVYPFPFKLIEIWKETVART